jgi:hypothetical protein
MAGDAEAALGSLTCRTGPDIRPCGVHLPAAVGRQRGSEHPVVAGQQRRPGRVPYILQAVSRSHDVGEQQRLHPTRDRHHLHPPASMERPHSMRAGTCAQTTAPSLAGPERSIQVRKHPDTLIYTRT